MWTKSRRASVAGVATAVSGVVIGAPEPRLDERAWAPLEEHPEVSLSLTDAAGQGAVAVAVITAIAASDVRTRNVDVPARERAVRPLGSARR